MTKQVDLSHIAEPLRKLAVPIAGLKLDPRNARSHDERNLEVIARSLERFGQDQPLVVRKTGKVVLKGNGRLGAARNLGWTHMAVVVVEDDKAEAVARAIADNRSAELAAWDLTVLADHLEALRADADLMLSTGFVEADLEVLRSCPSWPAGEGGNGSEYKAEEDTYLLKIEGVSQDDKDAVLEKVNAALEGSGYSAAAY